MVPILSTQWEVRAIAGEPKAVVRVRNLQAIVQGGTDAWGRPGKAQPALISAEISFVHPFGTVCSDDRLSPETVHYGKLSKAILEAVDDLNNEPPPLGTDGRPSSDASPTMKDVLDMIWARLTGLPVDGNAEEFSGSGETPFLNLRFIRFMSIKLTFPKASLLGEGVSLTASTLYGPFAGGYGCLRYALSLRLCNLKVPTLIGVNPNERHNKQFCVADIELENFICLEDMYTDLEKAVVSTMSHSSFETLEALGAKVTEVIFREVKLLSAGDVGRDVELPIRVTLEKPTAVPMADCPVVEMRTTHGGKIVEGAEKLQSTFI
ncbi:Dihydroneopterin aldolase-domain-containing protein [Coniochaeta sp. 2T2.1]|nr:Dihydroneopterin aldolase-domain-containing protein [Coniochaeta sp. 2T2.1]